MASISTGRPVVRITGLLATLIVALCALIGAGAAPSSAASHTIVIKNYAYSPTGLTVTEGDTVTWTNQDTAEHDIQVTSGPVHFHSPMLAKGESWSYTFGTPGGYSYLCSVHPDMTASVTVRAKPTPSPTKSTQKATTAPAVAAPTTTPPASRTATGTTPPATSAPAAGTTAHVAGPVTTAEVPATVAPAASPATLDPLLVVAGASTAVTVFCLLLLTSRPARQPEENETEQVI